MDLKEKFDEIEELIENDPLDEFRTGHSGPTESLQRLTILIKDLATRISSPSVRNIVDGTTTYQIPEYSTGRDWFYWRKRQWVALKEAYNIAKENIMKKTLRPVDIIHEYGDKIFIIHGHDEEMKNKVQLLLTRSCLEDVVLHEQPDKGRTIIEKLMEEGRGACYAIALLSPDDELENGSLRARQNVILEIGYFLGRLGRDRIRLLKKGDIEIPSDLKGIIYENYDENGNWRMKILKEMKAVGINIDIEEVLDKY